MFGLPSSGVHSNGFSLVRRIVAQSGLAWDAPAPFAPLAHADGQSDLKAALVRLQAQTPLKATLDVKTDEKQGDGADAVEQLRDIAVMRQDARIGNHEAQRLGVAAHQHARGRIRAIAERRGGLDDALARGLADAIAGRPAERHRHRRARDAGAARDIETRYP